METEFNHLQKMIDDLFDEARDLADDPDSWAGGMTPAACLAQDPTGGLRPILNEHALVRLRAIKRARRALMVAKFDLAD